MKVLTGHEDILVTRNQETSLVKRHLDSPQFPLKSRLISSSSVMCFILVGFTALVRRYLALGSTAVKMMSAREVPRQPIINTITWSALSHNVRPRDHCFDSPHVTFI